MARGAMTRRVGGAVGGVGRDAQVSNQRVKSRWALIGLSKAGQEGEGNREGESIRGGSDGTAESGGGIKRGARENVERVIDGQASGATSGTQGSPSSREGNVVEVAEAKANGTCMRNMGGTKGRGEGHALGMAENGRADEKNVTEQLHESGIVREWDLPSIRIRDVDHSRHDSLRPEVTFGEGFAGNRNEAGVGTCGDPTGQADVVSKLTGTVGPGSSKLISNILFKPGLVSYETEVTDSARAVQEGPGAKD